MIDDTSSDDQEVTRMEDVLLENIDMLSDKRYMPVYVDVYIYGALVVQKTDFLLLLTLIKCFVKRLSLIFLLEGGHYIITGLLFCGETCGLCVIILCNSAISLYDDDVIVNLCNYKTSKLNETFHLYLS